MFSLPSFAHHAHTALDVRAPQCAALRLGRVAFRMLTHLYARPYKPIAWLSHCGTGSSHAFHYTALAPFRQVNNEELYFLYIYINIHSNNIKELNYLINKIEGICQSNGLQTKKANFRQEQLFNSCMPYMINNEDLKITAKRNILTSSLVSTYPFISSSIFDDNGIFIGTNIYDNSLVFIDRFEKEKYKNANMCVFGTSGARKILFY